MRLLRKLAALIISGGAHNEPMSVPLSERVSRPALRPHGDCFCGIAETFYDREFDRIMQANGFTVFGPVARWGMR